MSDILAAFGVGGDDLASQIDTVNYPKPVEGRVAHIDADFLAYQVSAETRDELDGIKPRKSLEDMKHNARNAAEHLMRCAGATSYRCHVTPSASTKGGRPAQAVQQEYQSVRKGRDKPEFLDTIRAFIGQELNGVVHLDQEADDGMAQANYNDTEGLSVIVSKDKDLRMVPGLHYCFDQEKVVNVKDTFGEVWVDDTKSSKTVKGWGTKFFWAQCLMGDSADTILGLPALCGTLHTEYFPTAKFKADMEKLYDLTVPEKTRLAAEKRIDAARSTTKQVGPVAAFEIIKDTRNDREAFELVRNCFNGLEKEHGYEFTHWATGQRVTPTQALLGDMQLLWMRRNKNPLDVLEWIKETIK